MPGNGKSESITFQLIVENKPEAIFADTDASVKARHGGLALKLPKNKNKLSNFLNNSVANSDEVFNDDLESSVSNETLSNSSEEGTINNNFTKEYVYNCITMIENQKITNVKREILDLTKDLKIIEETNLDIEKKISIIRENISSEILQLSSLKEHWRNQHFSIDNANEQNITNSQLRTYAFYQDEIKDKNQKIKELDNKKEELKINLQFNRFKIKKIKDKIDNFNSKLQKYSDKLVPVSLKKKINKRLELQKKFEEENLNVKQKIKILANISELKREMKKEWNTENQKVKRIYEEIFPIEDKVFYVTTLVYNDQSIVEEVIYFDNDENDELVVWKQIKNYQNIEEYKTCNSLIDKENPNVTTIPIKEFLFNLDNKLNKKISKSEWIIFISITILSIALLCIAPASAPFLLAIAWEKALFSVVGVIIGVIVNKIIWDLVTEKTKKIADFVKQKFFSSIRKIPFLNKRSIGKTKQEVETKSNIQKILSNLRSNKEETRLEAQFDILKQELDNRKSKNVDQIVIEEGIGKVKNDIMSIPKSFDAAEINAQNIEPARNASRVISRSNSI